VSVNFREADRAVRLWVNKKSSNKSPTKRHPNDGGKIVLLVGAGASFGAGGGMRPSPPPLGDNLFPALEKRFPETWGGLESEVSKPFVHDGFEAGMVNLLTSGYSSLCNRLLLNLAVFFAEFSFSNTDSFYHQVAKCILKSNGVGRTTVASLNYECLFELAARNVGLSVSCTRQGREAEDIVVLKPHGSCNFLPALNGNRFIGTQFTGTAEIGIYQGPLTVVSPREVLSYIASGQSIPPSMSFYAPGKHTPVGAEAIASVRQEWASACAEADAIFMVGCRPSNADKHLFQPVVDSRSQVFMVGGRDGAEFATFSAALGTRLRYIADHCDVATPEVLKILRDRLSRPK